MAHPRFKSFVEPIIDFDDGLFLLSEGESVWLPGAIYAAVAPLLDGTHDIESIFDALSESHEAADVFEALDHLRTSGYLTEDAAHIARDSAAFWEYAGQAPLEAQSRFRAAPVAVLALGSVDLSVLPALLERNGLIVGTEGEFTIVATDDYLRKELVEWNVRACAFVRKGVATREAGRRGDVDRTAFRPRKQCLLGVPRAPSAWAPPA